MADFIKIAFLYFFFITYFAFYSNDCIIKPFIVNVIKINYGGKLFTISNGNRTEWIVRSRSGSPICLSRVWLQTELDDTKSYYQLIIKITIPRKEEHQGKKGKNYIKSFYTVSMVIETKVVIGWFKWQLKMWLVDLNYNFECDWLIELTDNKLSEEAVR